MGGHAAGNVASHLAVATLEAAFPHAPSPLIHAPALARRLIRAFEAANTAILAHASEHPEYSGMGTTLTALSPLVAAPQCVIAHVGDSRAYRLRGDAISCLTTDHTWVQQQVDAGMLMPAEVRHHPLSSVLSRVLGTAEVGPADTFVTDVLPGDLFLLCSDGLTNVIEDDDLAVLMTGPGTLDERAAALVATANERGGPDNITVLLLAAEAA